MAALLRRRRHTLSCGHPVGRHAEIPSSCWLRVLKPRTCWHGFGHRRTGLQNDAFAKVRSAAGCGGCWAAASSKRDWLHPSRPGGLDAVSCDSHRIHA